MHNISRLNVKHDFTRNMPKNFISYKKKSYMLRRNKKVLYFMAIKWNVQRSWQRLNLHVVKKFLFLKQFDETSSTWVIRNQA